MNTHFTGAVLTFAFACALPAAHAQSAAAPGEAQWRSECGSCHIAYPAKLMSAAGWQRLMSGLDKHFGTDAGLDAQATSAIRGYLLQNAGGERRAPGNMLRISEAPWWQRKHDELDAAVWKRPTIKSAANCGACHTDAESGGFRERNVRIPR